MRIRKHVVKNLVPGDNRFKTVKGLAWFDFEIKYEEVFCEFEICWMTCRVLDFDLGKSCKSRCLSNKVRRIHVGTFTCVHVYVPSIDSTYIYLM